MSAPQPTLVPRSRRPRLWRSLDRSIPLGVKLIVPLIIVTLAGTALFGFIRAQQVRATIDDANAAATQAAGEAASRVFYATISDPQGANLYLSDVASAQPNMLAIWIVSVVLPGAPVVASSIATDVNRTGLIDSTDVLEIQSGRSSTEKHTVNGQHVLESLYPVKGNAFAVVIWKSLTVVDAEIASSLVALAVTGVIECILEVVVLTAIFEVGVLRRIRRVRDVVASFESGRNLTRLPEGLEPEGRDALFNLARNVDHKLVELSEREMAGDVVSQLGLLALQGARPSELTSKALDLTRRAADLDQCFLVENTGASTVVESYGAPGGRTSEGTLPVWLGALVRSATQSRRPILADALGQDCRFWVVGAAGNSAAAAFVPLPGNPTPIGVMVGIAAAGSLVTPLSVSLMEAVATALGESLQRSEADKARHESETKSKALATVSHEMRNPLNAMLGFSSLLLSGAAGPLTQKQQSYVGRVDDASHHLLRLVDEYLDLARVMAGSLPVQPEAVSVGPEVENVLGLLRPTAEAKNVSLHSEVAPDAIAHADRTRLRQVLMNLVSNAIRFTPARGHVRIEVAGGPNGVRISVIDTGVGIPVDRQHLIFTEFAQVNADGFGGGPGLGLSLTKKFVEAMGGFIRFTSSEGAGTIFDVWIPGEQFPRLAPGAREALSAA